MIQTQAVPAQTPCPQPSPSLRHACSNIHLLASESTRTPNHMGITCHPRGWPM